MYTLRVLPTEQLACLRIVLPTHCCVHEDSINNEPRHTRWLEWIGRQVVGLSCEDDRGTHCTWQQVPGGTPRSTGHQWSVISHLAIHFTLPATDCADARLE